MILHGVILMKGKVDLKERRKRSRRVDEENGAMLMYDCNNACEDQIQMVAECPLYDKKREMYTTDLG